MKHTMPVTLVLVLLFVISQIIGLYIVDLKLDKKATAESGQPVFSQTPGVQTPDVPKTTSFLYIIGAVILGTLLVLLIIKFKQRNMWKIWFFLSVLVCLYSAFYPMLNEYLGSYSAYAISVSLIFAAILAIFKVFKPNIFVHNFTELFIYGGLTSIFIPIINIFSATMLLLIISVYDIYAVRKSKHMVKMAKFQTESNLFAGISIKYKRTKLDADEIVDMYKTDKVSNKKQISKSIKHASKIQAAKHTKKDIKTDLPKTQESTAILGGGDIAFPMIFASAIMIKYGYFKAAIVITTITASLIFLFALAKKDKFYPAMPFLTTGCLIGFGLIYLF